MKLIPTFSLILGSIRCCMGGETNAEALLQYEYAVSNTSSRPNTTPRDSSEPSLQENDAQTNGEPSLGDQTQYSINHNSSRSNTHPITRDVLRETHPVPRAFRDQFATKLLTDRIEGKGIDGGRVVGGTEVSPKEKYPWMVAGMYGNQQVCGGSLITHNLVLSAAHCDPYITKVRIGLHDKYSDPPGSYEEFNVQSVIKHPSYNANTFDYDFMLLKLDGSSDHDSVKLNCGNNSVNLSTGVDLKTIGWGTTSFGGSSSAVLLEAVVDYIPNSTCNANYSSGMILPSMMCAARSGKDACQGDSGGPIVLKSNDTQVGVVSWGYGCAHPSYPGVYSRVSQVCSWIEDNMPAPAPSAVIGPSIPIAPIVIPIAPPVLTPAPAFIPIAPVKPIVPIAPISPIAPIVPTSPIKPVVPIAPISPVVPIAPISPVVPIAPPISPVVPIAPPISPVLVPIAPSPSVIIAPSIPIIGTPVKEKTKEEDCNNYDWKDAFEFECDWYKMNDLEKCPYWGGTEGTQEYTANEACCWCGGGLKQ